MVIILFNVRALISPFKFKIQSIYYRVSYIPSKLIENSINSTARFNLSGYGEVKCIDRNSTMYYDICIEYIYFDLYKSTYH